MPWFNTGESISCMLVSHHSSDGIELMPQALPVFTCDAAVQLFHQVKRDPRQQAVYGCVLAALAKQHPVIRMFQAA